MLQVHRVSADGTRQGSITARRVVLSAIPPPEREWAARPVLMRKSVSDDVTAQAIPGRLRRRCHSTTMPRHWKRRTAQEHRSDGRRRKRLAARDVNQLDSAGGLTASALHGARHWW